jgi:hypothetical protein
MTVHDRYGMGTGTAVVRYTVGRRQQNIHFMSKRVTSDVATHYWRVSASRALRGLRGLAAEPQEDVCREEAKVCKEEEG